MNANRVTVTQGQYAGRSGRLLSQGESGGGFALPVPADQAAWRVVWLDRMAGPVRVPAYADAPEVQPADPELSCFTI